MLHQLEKLAYQRYDDDEKRVARIVLRVNSLTTDGRKMMIKIMGEILVPQNSNPPV